MKVFISILALITVFFADVGDDIATHLKHGTYQEIYKYLDEKVVIKIADKEDLLSKEQCQANLNYFFEKNNLKNFSLIQNTMLNANAQFIYGIADAGSSKYKISFLIKKSLIVQIRIEYYE